MPMRHIACSLLSALSYGAPCLEWMARVSAAAGFILETLALAMQAVNLGNEIQHQKANRQEADGGPERKHSKGKRSRAKRLARRVNEANGQMKFA